MTKLWFLLISSAAFLNLAGETRADEQAEHAGFVLKQGYSRSGIILGATPRISPVKNDGNLEIAKAADDIQRRLNETKWGAQVLRATGYLIGESIAAAADDDPDPMSSMVLKITGDATKKGFEFAADYAVQKAGEDVAPVVKSLLAKNGITKPDLTNKSDDQIREMVKTLDLFGTTVSDALKDAPNQQKMLGDALINYKTNVEFENFINTRTALSDLEQVKQKLDSASEKIDDLKDHINERFDKIESGLSDLKLAAAESAASLDALTAITEKNAKALNVLSIISFEGWSTSQKLHAVESGMFPDLKDDALRDTLADLKTQERREKAVAKLNDVTTDLSGLVQISQNIGLPVKVTRGLQAAQIVANSAAKFASGDIIGGIAGVTSLLGLGAPDPAAERHEQLMSYLDSQFEQVNARLATIEALQRETLQAIGQLRDAQARFETNVNRRLDRLQTEVERNGDLLRRLMLEQYLTCDVVASEGLNNFFELRSLKDIETVARRLNERVKHDNVAQCYKALTDFLAGHVGTPNWDNTRIDGSAFFSNVPAATGTLREYLQKRGAFRESQYAAARKLFLASADLTQTDALKHLARLLTPSRTAEASEAVHQLLESGSVERDIAEIDCANRRGLSPGMMEMICKGIQPGVRMRPTAEGITKLLDQPLIGSESRSVLEMGLALAVLVDFGVYKNDNEFNFIDADKIRNYVSNGSDELESALASKRSAALLNDLTYLTDAALIQQSLANGDYIAALVERQLYNPTIHAFSTKYTPADGDDQALIESKNKLKGLALEVMRLNPSVARNAVLLGMRHAIADQAGGQDGAIAGKFNQSIYKVGLMQFAGVAGCTNFADKTRVPEDNWSTLQELFPSWNFRFVESAVFESERTKAYPGEARQDFCVDEILEDIMKDPPQIATGEGIAVELGGIYVTVPSPANLDAGIFERPRALDDAIQDWQRVSTALTDRQTPSEIVTSPHYSQLRRDTLALELTSILSGPAE